MARLVRRLSFKGAARAFTGALFLWFSALVLPTLAQTPEDAEATSPVIVDGTTVMTLSGTSSFPAAQRSTAVAQRIVNVAEASEAMTFDIDIVKDEFGHAVTVDGNQIVVATELDAKREGFVNTQLTAQLYANLIEKTIRTYRAERTSDAYKHDLLAGLGWTALFAAFTAVLWWGNRRLRTRIEKLVHHQMRAVEEATNEIVRSRVVAEVVAVAVQGVMMIIFFFALYYYVSGVLFSFAATRPTATLLLNYVTDPIFRAVRAFIDFIPDLIVLAIIFFVTRYLIRIAQITFENIEAGTLRIEGFEKHWVWPSFNITRAFLVISALILAYPYIPGSDSTAFKGVSILLGLMASIGSNSSSPTFWPESS